MTPSPLQPGSSYAQPFELLAACHERVERSLTLLERLLAHLQQGGDDAMARAAAADIRRYFGQAAPLHHQDEELHVFPALDGDAALAAVCRQLRTEHREMEAQWALLDPALAALDDLPRLQTLARPFIALQRQHLRREDSEVFAAAHGRLSAAGCAAMGREMAARRGLRLTE